MATKQVKKESFKKGDVVETRPGITRRTGLRKGKYKILKKLRGFLPKHGVYEAQHEKADYVVHVQSDEVVLVRRARKPKEK